MLWFKNEDRLIGETQSFDIIKTNDKYASVRWIKSNGIKEMLFGGYYENCVASLGYIQANIVKEEDTIIDLSAFNELTHTLPTKEEFEKMVDETFVELGFKKEKDKENNVDDGMKLLKDNVGKFFTYEQWKENIKPQQEEKEEDIKIIRSKEDLANALRHYKRINGFKSDRELAKAFDVSPTTLWEWVNKRRFPKHKSTRDTLARKLNIRFIIDC